MIAIGIDVSKSKSTICMISSDGEILLSPTDYKHNISDLSRLLEKIHSYNDSVYAAMEATGHYHYPILKFLSDNNIPISLINPFLMKQYANNTLRKGKTDKKDAIKIASFVLEKSYQLIPYNSLEKKYDDLRFLSRQYQQNVSIKVTLRVHLANLLDETMPGILQILTPGCTTSVNTLFYDFIVKYESFSKIQHMGMKRFINSFMKFADKYPCRNVHSKALSIYELAKNRIVTRENDICTIISLKNQSSMLKQCEIYCLEILHQMQSIATTLPEYKTVLAMNGVGQKLAPLLIAEIGDIRRFHSAKALNAYAGNDAPPYQSGQFEGTRRHISKRGSAHLRKLCYEVMQALKLHKITDDPIYQFMIKKLK